jgi:hypothetical protein
MTQVSASACPGFGKAHSQDRIAKAEKRTMQEVRRMNANVQSIGKSHMALGK